MEESLIPNDADLVAMLNKGRVLDSQEILSNLGIDPKDIHAMKLIANQLDELRRLDWSEKLIMAGGGYDSCGL